MKNISKVIAFILFVSPLNAQVPADLSLQIDEIFKPWDSANMPGCAIGISQNGLTVFEGAYGMADLEWGIPNTPETIFEGGSLSKQFTAAAIILLVLDEKISMDDDIRQYIPELPDYGNTITVRHLLNHTSGLRDWGSVAALSGWGRSRRAHTHEDVLEILSRQSALNYVPGNEYSYTNSGYNLMAILVGRVSGTSFAEFSRQRIFEPLGLENTQWRDDFRRIVKGRSSAYNVSGDDSVEINRPVEDVHGNGGILTTVSDLLRWNQTLTDERLGQRFTELMEQRGVLSDGTEIGYASGLTFSDQLGVTAIQHTGSTAGYRAYTGRVEEAGLAWALLCNASNGLNPQTGPGLVTAILGDRAPELPMPEAEQLPLERLQLLSGLYRELSTGRSREIRLEDGKLMSQSTPWIPLSEQEFVAGPQRLRYVFEPDRPNQRPRFRVDGWQTIGQMWVQTDSWLPEMNELRTFEGKYISEEADTTYAIIVEEGKLVLHRRLDFTATLEPTYQDAFDAGNMALTFHKDDSGNVNQLSVSVGRVYDMRFDRVRD